MAKKKYKKPKTKADSEPRPKGKGKDKAKAKIKNDATHESKRKGNGKGRKPLRTVDANEAPAVLQNQKAKAKPQTAHRHQHIASEIINTMAQGRSNARKGWGKGVNRGLPRAQSRGAANPNNVTSAKYGLVESAERLHQQGFHPNVTDLSPFEHLAKWVRLAESRQAKPTIEEKYGDLPEGIIKSMHGGFKRLGLGDCDIFMCPDLFFGHKDSNKYTQRSANVVEQDRSVQKEDKATILTVLAKVDVGEPIDVQIFFNGLRAVKALALSSKKIWQHIATSTNVWNFPEQTLAATGFGPVFVAVNPEFNIEQFRRSKDLTYPDPEDNVPSIDMRHRAEQSEWLMLQEILHDRLLLFRAGPDDKLPTKGLPSYWGLLERVPPKAMKRIMLDSQFVSTMPGNAKFETGEYLNAECLRRLIREIYSRRNSMQVLYLCEIPLLDRSLLAVILKGLPKVTMVGIYDCPLIGFSDLLSILDIVHTVNNDRVTAGLPKIDSLDLRPYFETGQAADWHDKNELHGAAEYGISWAPINLKTWQRGFYGIILRAVIKSESMGLKLLFDKHCALLEFLFRVPNVPLGVPTFLDGLYRWLDLSKTHDSENKEMKKAMFDMLKPVCVTIDSRWDDENSSSKWYQLVMGQEKYKCAICGFSTLAEFFYMAGCRMCSVCELERELSMQKHHHMNVLECPKVFFKHGERFEPNDEVTLLPRAAKLLERTNHAISLETPSVRQLRTLEELARPCLPKTVNLWQPLIDICNCLDYRVRVVRFGIREGYFKRNDPYPPCPHGLPSTNWQHQPPACSSMSRTWASALEAHKWHMEAGWVPGFKPKGLEKPIIW